jgi:tetratricopeptide (TPR) repeat protein
MLWKRLLFVVAVLLLEGGLLQAGGDPVLKARRDLDAGHFREAMRTLNEVLDRHPDETEALRLRALTESGLGDFDGAVRDYESILAREADDAESQRDLGLILAFKKRDPRRALMHLDRYLSLSQNRNDAIKRMASPEVVRTAKIMRSLDTSHTTLESRAMADLLEMARTFESEGNHRLAIRSYERVLQISPTCAPCHEALGRLLLNRHHREEGEGHLAKARLFGWHG